MALLTTEERDAARYMTLDGVASSDAAKELIERLSDGLVHQRRKRSLKSYQRAVGAILCDFLRAAETDSKRWSYRAFGAGTFTGERIGFRPFTTAIDDMSNTMMVELAKGHQQWDRVMGEGPEQPSWARATRLRPTAWLMRLMAESGLTPDTWRDHFELVEPEKSLVKDPIVLRRRTVRHKGERYKGYGTRLDLENPKARQLKERMDRLNRFYMEHTFGPMPFLGVRRIYNNVDMPGFDFDQGGRIYAVGGGYQTMKKAERSSITIDGEPTAEIDVKASHISILSQRRGMPLDPLEDPYEIEGLPREVVKAVVTMTLGHERFHSRWPKKVKERLEEKLGVQLRKEYPLKKVLPLVVQKLPALREWGETNISCFDLQFVESEALLLAVERLAYDYGVPSLPIHDSLIVSLVHLELAKDTLANSFEEVTGYRPQLKWTQGNLRETKKDPLLNW